MGTSGTPLQYNVIVDIVWLRSFTEPTMYRSTIPLRFIWSICSGN